MPGTYNEHFDVCLSKKRLAIENGATSISMMNLGRKIAKRPGSPFYGK